MKGMRKRARKPGKIWWQVARKNFTSSGKASNFYLQPYKDNMTVAYVKVIAHSFCFRNDRTNVTFL